jgi:hypothetical protein
MTTCRRCGHDWMQHIVSKMPDTVGCEECKTDEPLSVCFPDWKSASREEIQHLYGSVLSQQDALLHAARTRPGAYYTGDILVDSRLGRLYVMQSRLESILASFQEVANK